MNELFGTVDSRYWEDAISPFWKAVFSPFRRLFRYHHHKLVKVEVEGAEIVSDLVASGAGVLITPNHSSHSDVLVVQDLSEMIGHHFHIMTAAQLFAAKNAVVRWIFRKHGSFSIDRLGTDIRGLKRSVKVLEESSHPLLIFPEGEVYHLNSQARAFRDGASVIALMAARHGKRPVHCVPCCFRYNYVTDPTPELTALMEALERSANWRPRPEMSLKQRVLRFAAGQTALKEVEYLGHPQEGDLRYRLDSLREAILSPLEKRYGITVKARSFPERIKEVRRACTHLLMEEDGEGEGDGDKKEINRPQIEADLQDVFVTTQLFSYTGDYLHGDPEIERLAETIDKWEEDVMGVPFATFRATRRVTVRFGEPVDPGALGKGSARKLAPKLTQEIEDRVQALLDAPTGKA